MRELPEGKIACKQIRTGEGRWVRISNENMAHKTPTKLANIKICRCCCKPLGSNDHLISLFGERESNHGRIQWNYWPCCKPRHACAVKLELLKSWSGNLIILELCVLVITKRHMGSGIEIGLSSVDYCACTEVIINLYSSSAIPFEYVTEINWPQRPWRKPYRN